METKSGAIVLLIFILSALFGWLYLESKSSPAPDVTFQTITGKKINLDAQRGKPVIITFWATDCPGCIKEIPHFIELYEDFHHRGLEIIAVAMYYDPPNHVVTMSKARQLPYHVALDLHAEIARAFGEVRLTPTTFLVAPDGTVVLKKTGTFDIDNMKSQIETMLKG